MKGKKTHTINHHNNLYYSPIIQLQKGGCKTDRG